jgi:hypothetical protein
MICWHFQATNTSSAVLPHIRHWLLYNTFSLEEDIQRTWVLVVIEVLIWQLLVYDVRVRILLSEVHVYNDRN